MHKAAALITLLALTGAPALAAGPPVVVELYTAQGCSSCVRANALVGDLAEREDVLPLTFAVDYWDYLGWPDTFAKPGFAERQRAYVKRLGLAEVYTPQVVIDGREQAAGGRPEKIETLVDEAAQARRNPPDMLAMKNGRVAVGSGPVPSGGGEVWLIRYDPREIEVEVKKGDNRGETIVHRNVVREMVRLGDWRGRPTAYKLPKAEDEDAELQAVVIVQQVGGGRIIGVLKLKL